MQTDLRIPDLRLSDQYLAGAEAFHAGIPLQESQGLLWQSGWIEAEIATEVIDGCLDDDRF